MNLNCSFRRAPRPTRASPLLRKMGGSSARDRVQTMSGASQDQFRSLNGNFYELLDVRMDASLSEIKAAYRVRAKLLHPDFNKQDGAEEAFQRVKMAYEVLADEELKEDYDEHLKMGGLLVKVMLMHRGFLIFSQASSVFLFGKAMEQAIKAEDSQKHQC